MEVKEWEWDFIAIPSLEEYIEKHVEEISEKPEIVKKYVDNIIKDAEDGLNKISTFLHELYRKVLGEQVGSIVEAIGERLASVLLYIVIYFGTVRGQIEVLSESGRQLANKDLRPQLLDLMTLLDAYSRRLVSDMAFNEELSRMGYSPERINILKQIAKRMLSTNDVLDLYKKGGLGYDESLDRLKRLGYEDADAKMILKYAKPALPIDIAIRAWFMRALDDKAINNILRRHGYEDYDAEIIKYVSRPLLGVVDLISAFRRHLIDENTLRTLLQWHGFDNNEIDLIKELSKVIPSLSDLVTFAVRDVFNDSVVKKYGYDEEFPEDFAYYASMHGLDRKWALAYWRAHWQLPSPTMAFEMFRRGIISDRELDDLLKIADYPRYWRERMKELAYEIPTRVDIRRMYELQVISEKDVYEFYRKLGYSPDHAKALTEYTILDTLTSERNSVIKEIEKCYKDGLIDKNDAIDMLSQLKVNKPTIDLLIQAWELSEQREYVNMLTESVHDRFRNGVITELQARQELTALGLKGRQIETYITKWKIEKSKLTKTLTVTQISSAYKLNIISFEQALDRLVALGYTREDAEIILKLVRKGVST